MYADSAGELRVALEALEACLTDAAGWIEEQNVPADESPYRVFGPKRSALVLDAFRDALNVGAFADDEWMQEERALAFSNDPATRKPFAIVESVDQDGNTIKVVPTMSRQLKFGYWLGYQPFSGPRAMFIERLLRGWLRSCDFGPDQSQDDVVDLPPFRVLTVKLYACGLRCLARAVRLEIERRWSPIQSLESESPQAVHDPAPPLPEPEDPIEDALGGKPLNLYRFLKQRRQWTSFDTLAERRDCWRVESPEDDTIAKALKRIQTVLNGIENCPAQLVVNKKERRTRLDK